MQLHLLKGGFCWLNTHLCRGAGMAFAHGLAFSDLFSLSRCGPRGFEGPEAGLSACCRAASVQVKGGHKPGG